MGLSFVAEQVRVRVPATSANLGPGFDSLGLALALYDEVSARVTPAGCQVTVTGAGAGELPDDDTHLVVRAMRAAFDVLGGQPTGLALDCLNRIPQARGLGSSSAAIVAGVQLARGLVVDGVRRLDDDGALRLAAEIEGHPDNVAPCLLGGFTIAWTEAAPLSAGLAASGPTAVTSGSDGVAVVDGTGVVAGAPLGAVAPVSRFTSGARAVALVPSAAIAPVLFVPEERGLTAVARAALPETVPHRDAARNAGRAALLVHALTADPSLLFTATEDRLHQDYRAAGMPGTAALLTALRAAGVAAVVSGAGPTVLALSSPPEGFEPGMGWSVRLLPVDVTGALLDRGRLGHAERDPVAAGRKS